MMYVYGVGAQVDLPNFSAVVAGLDAWDNPTETIEEPRLLAAVRAELGPQVGRLVALPWQPETGGALLDDSKRVGVPVVPFPRWMRCSACNAFASFDAGIFTFKPNPWRPERASFVHAQCPKAKRAPLAVPARFVVACKKGHLDDFPWVAFVHRYQPCPQGAPSLRMIDVGSGTRSTDVLIECQCGQRNAMRQIFGRTDRSATLLPRCRGRHVHLRRFDPVGCAETAEAVLLGASNLWFPETRSVFAIPAHHADVLDRLVAENWAVFALVNSKGVLAFALAGDPRFVRFQGHELDAVWEAIERHRQVPMEEGEERVNLKGPEWACFIEPARAPRSDDLELAEVEVPARFRGRIAHAVQAARLRAVVAQIGFARIEMPDWALVEEQELRTERVPIANAGPFWVPAAEMRGEGIFLRLSEDAVATWSARVGRSERMRALYESHRRRSAAAWPGARYVLLHSLAHLLINEVALDCGYSAASVRERIYVREDSGAGDAMAGILLYTAAPDAEGTLGGLVSLATPDTLEHLISGALRRAEICASDPLCAEHVPDAAHDTSLHGAACHACLLLPETSCEAGNRYLDRTVLVETMTRSGLEYFE